MSSRELRGLLAPALLLFGLTACEGVPEGRTTLPTTGGVANPPVPASADIVPATPTTLAEHVVSKARSLARGPWLPTDTVLPERLEALDYEAYRSIRFRPDAALWRDTGPFQLQLMHPGFVFPVPVRIHLVGLDAVQHLPFDPSLFSYDGSAAPSEESARSAASADAELGYSGFRVHYPLNRPDVADEVAVFQGASYFRLLGPGHLYGLSSRGLGIDIGGDEVFPEFREFWLVRPDSGASSLVFHALLDSPTVTGAYRFELTPGETTVLSVDARLFARADAPRIGVAPLTSMYLHGQTGGASYDDFRPEVHDSDGLLMQTRVDEWIWRPLSNRRSTSLTALLDVDPRGFGLVQRARSFDRYLDLEARYHRRPSEWVRVHGSWGAGSVQLLELPTESEFNDNIAASWVPDGVFHAGEERRYRYDLVMFDDRLPTQTLAQVERTRSGRDALPGAQAPPPRSQRRFIVDFVGESLPTLGEPPVSAKIETSAGQISDLHTSPLPSGQGWRASFRLVPDGDRPADMRLHLLSNGERVSETWTYLWSPEEVG
jgi:glucans biosynthesis protein